MQTERYPMEKKLTKLFDYQKFAGNKALQGIIDSVHARSGRRELSLDEEELVNAAGAPYAGQTPPEDQKKDLN